VLRCVRCVSSESAFAVHPPAEACSRSVESRPTHRALSACLDKDTAGGAHASASKAPGAGSLERLSSGQSRSASSSGCRQTTSDLFLPAPVLRSSDRFGDPQVSDPASRNAAQLTEPAVPPTVDGLVPHLRGGFR
jgi:hypothetical protein